MDRFESLIQRGFTLVELLVVILIISIATTMVMLSFSYTGESYQAEQLAKRLRLVALSLQNQALVEARPYALTIEHGQIKLLRLISVNHDAQWQILAIPRELKTKNLILKPAMRFNPVIVINPDGTMMDFIMNICNQQGKPLFQVQGIDAQIVVTKAS